LHDIQLAWVSHAWKIKRFRNENSRLLVQAAVLHGDLVEAAADQPKSETFRNHLKIANKHRVLHI